MIHSRINRIIMKFMLRDPTTVLMWIISKNNTEFFSGSTGGRAIWWDIRKLRMPTEVLLFDLDAPNEQRINRAIGISSAHFEPSVSTKFIFGLQNGVVISGSRKAKTPAEKLAVRFNAHYGPVNSIERNSFNPKIFLTVGDSRVIIWTEDYRQDNLVSTKYLFYVRNDESIQAYENRNRNSIRTLQKKDASRLDRSDRLHLFRSLSRYLLLSCLELMPNKSYKSGWKCA